MLSQPGSASRELAEISCVSQGLIFFGSLLPVAIVDSGTLLKWSLVDQGQTGEEADRQVRRASIGTGWPGSSIRCGDNLGPGEKKTRVDDAD